jgi:hypothetical protein
MNELIYAVLTDDQRVRGHLGARFRLQRARSLPFSRQRSPAAGHSRGGVPGGPG